MMDGKMDTGQIDSIPRNWIVSKVLVDLEIDRFTGSFLFYMRH